MARFIIDRDSPTTVEARSITAAVEAYVHEHAEDGGWSDSFDLEAREERATHWCVFSVTTRTEFIVTVGREKRGPAVEADDAEAAQ